jgi:hypothetical protein
MAYELAQEIISARQVADTARASFPYTYDRYDIMRLLLFFLPLPFCFLLPFGEGVLDFPQFSLGDILYYYRRGKHRLLFS